MVRVAVSIPGFAIGRFLLIFSKLITKLTVAVSGSVKAADFFCPVYCQLNDF